MEPFVTISKAVDIKSLTGKGSGSLLERMAGKLKPNWQNSGEKVSRNKTSVMRCKRLESVKKKTYGYQERDHLKRQEFQERLKTKTAAQMVYVVRLWRGEALEAGIDNRDEYAYGYCEIGKRFHALKSGKRTERVSWIAALKQGHIFAPMTFIGCCNRDLFEVWLEKCLLPQLQPGDAIVIDNASFHHAQSIEDIVAAAGCELVD